MRFVFKKMFYSGNNIKETKQIVVKSVTKKNREKIK